jgi:hypothetical protein
VSPPAGLALFFSTLLLLVLVLLLLLLLLFKDSLPENVVIRTGDGAGMILVSVEML